MFNRGSSARFGFIRASPESLSATLAANAVHLVVPNSSIVSRGRDLQDRRHETDQKYRDDPARGLFDR